MTLIINRGFLLLLTSKSMSKQAAFQHWPYIAEVSQYHSMSKQSLYMKRVLALLITQKVVLAAHARYFY